MHGYDVAVELRAALQLYDAVAVHLPPAAVHFAQVCSYGAVAGRLRTLAAGVAVVCAEPRRRRDGECLLAPASPPGSSGCLQNPPGSRRLNPLDHKQDSVAIPAVTSHGVYCLWKILEMLSRR
jgi:hypothetical protein